MASGRTDSCLTCVSLDWQRLFLPNVQLGLATGGSPGSIACAGHGYVTNTIIKFDAVGITTLSLLSFYYVVFFDANTFQLASTPSGSPIDFTNTDTVSFEEVVLGCHRAAPNAPQGTVPVPNTQWQNVSLDYWCREFEPSAPVIAREVLTAARTYYVRTDGNDSNNGLSNTPAGAFLTIQGAINTISMSIDTSTYDVTIQVAAGTYSSATGNVCLTVPGQGSIIIVGDEVTPSNVTVTTTSVMGILNANFFANNCATTYKIRGFTFTSSGSGSIYGIQARDLSYIEHQNNTFSAGFTAHLRASFGGILTATGNYSITAGASFHIDSTAQGITRDSLLTVTVTGTPAFTDFVHSEDGSLIYSVGNTYSGGATGTRYLANTNSVIETQGGGANYFPGNVGGSTASGGQYA